MVGWHCTRRYIKRPWVENNPSMCWKTELRPSGPHFVEPRPGHEQCAYRDSTGNLSIPKQGDPLRIPSSS